MKVLIDSIYIHNLGGKTLLNYFINYLESKTFKNFFFLFDSRLEKEIFKNIEIHSYQILRASEFQRKNFYKKNQHLFNVILCFSNVPPPINLKQRVLIYFHNELLISTKSSDESVLKIILLKIKRAYILLKSQRHYKWIVQSDLMKKKLINFYKITNVYVYPFYEKVQREKSIKFKKNSFFYPASYSRHKNHKNLLKAFEIYSKENLEPVELNLTLENKEFEKLKKEFGKLFSLMKIINLGRLEKHEVLIYYQSSHFCIYPSLKESFGLPLIEAAQLNCIVLSSNLPFVDEVIKPSMVFEANSPKNIAKIIRNAVLTKNHKLAKLKVENKICKLISELNEDI